MKKEVLIEIITSLLIILFLYASFSKLFDLWYFKYDLAKQPFPKWFQHTLLWAIPFSEIFISGFIPHAAFYWIYSGYFASFFRFRSMWLWRGDQDAFLASTPCFQFIFYGHYCNRYMVEVSSIKS